jgi:hypothetical protein
MKHEPVCFLDLTGSQDDPITPGSDTQRKVVTLNTLRVFVRKLKEMDDAASDASLAGAAEKKGGGVLTFGFHGEGDAGVVELGDLNLGNVEDAIASLRFGGRTYIMPSIARWQGDRDEEFSQDEIKDVQRQFDLLFLTDGLIFDENTFLSWVGQAPSNHKVYFVVIGYDEDTEGALAGYQRIARQHPDQVYLYDMTHSSDPEAIASQMVALLS